MELISKLGIDWKLLLAQIINFAILAFVLYKFVFKTVLDTLENRSKAIEKGMHDAKAAEEKLREIEVLRDKRMGETEKQVGVLLERARKDAETMKEEIITTAKTQAEDLLRRTKVQIAEEKEKLMQAVRTDVGALVIQLTSTLLEREFSAADQKRLGEALAKEMKSI